VSKSSDNTAVSQNTDHFWIGGDDLCAQWDLQTGPADGQREGNACGCRESALDEIRILIGTLLKMETVSVLLGAGASFDCGGQLIGRVPVAIERVLVTEGAPKATTSSVAQWLLLFYQAARCCGATKGPITPDEILSRRDVLEGDKPSSLDANFEQVLAQLHRWRAALPTTGGRLQVDGSPALSATAEDLDTALQQATRALACACDLPTHDKKDNLETHKALLRKLLTRPLNLKRVNVFTLNYDTLVEQAADAEGVVLLDGFVGTQRRIFRPESYEQDLYFPAETTEGRVHRFDRVLHLYKLHGSITWRASEPTIDDPYGVQWVPFDPESSEPLLIYPTPAKYGETLGLPYSELFRRFSSALSRPQSVLFVIGYGFGDEHVNAIIRQALAVPSFTLVIVDPEPKSDFVQTLREQRDRRIWICEGPSVGTLAGFVERILPDLRDEEIRIKVLETYRALQKDSPPEGGPSLDA